MVETCAVSADGRKADVRVYRRVAVAGEMFGGRERAALARAADGRRDELGHAPRVFAEGADVDDGVVGVVVEVGDGAEQPVDAEGAGLLGGDAGLLVGG